MRLILLIGLLVACAGAIGFTLLNATAITIDFYAIRFSAPLGIALITAGAAGWLLGGVTAWLGMLLRTRTRRSRKRAVASAATAATDAAPP